jgi:hypothetical protein
MVGDHEAEASQSGEQGVDDSSAYSAKEFEKGDAGSASSAADTGGNMLLSAERA